MTTSSVFLHLLLATIPFAMAASAEDPFAAGVRPTDPLSPEEEQRSFVLPPGFEIQLVAAEPQIQKPMNLAFDTRGRLWVTDTIEYPYAAPADRSGRDSIKILEDADGDGRAERVTTFADGLNVPIGIYPWRGGAIAWSIPNLWLLEDRDGDGKADERRKLFGPFGFDRDTHGMNNAFRRHFDGWLYACHGFNNESRVAGTDGHEVHMQSGNTYRLRLDGSRIEQFTWGQVNPFGMAMDPLGNLFTCDCHSRPIYQLLRGGFYESFGKPHDGLGYAPQMMQHLHGSTANAGACYYTGDNFPAGFRGNVFTGNVMTSRVNRDSLERHGSTLLAKEEQDLVVTRDPWFRPVDIQLAPDGTIYIADFYNKIIGHYEVPLTHPGRDRHRGRIWRVVYRGDASESRPPSRPGDLVAAEAGALVEALAHPVQTTRTLAMHELVDRLGAGAVEPVRRALTSAKDPSVRSHALWILHRLVALEPEQLEAAAADADAGVRAHAMRLLSELPAWEEMHRRLALAGLQDADAFVERNAADALGRHPGRGQARALLARLEAARADDTHLVHVLRMALRDHLRDAARLGRLVGGELSAAAERAIAGIALSLEHEEAGRFLVRHLRTVAEPPEAVLLQARHAVKLLPPDELDALIAFLREKLAGDLDRQVSLLGSIDDGLKARGAAAPASFNGWGAELSRNLLRATLTGASAWRNVPTGSAPSAENPWVFESRRSADGQADRRFLGSFPRGEQLTGILRSAPFTAPARLAFFVAGHDGFPGQPRGRKNLVRLVSVEDGAVLAEAPAPRNDVAQRVDWDLAAHAGRLAVIEIVDGDTDPAYAWIAAGGFEPEVAALPDVPPRVRSERQRLAAEIAARLKLAGEKELLHEALAAAADPAALQALARALLAIEPDARLEPLAAILGEAAAPERLRQQVAALIAGRDAAKRPEVVKEAMKSLPARLQNDLARALASDRSGAEELLELVQAGHASARVLQRRATRDRLVASGIERAAERIDALTEGLPADEDARRAAIEARRRAFLAGGGNAAKGALVFEKTCAACHQVAGKGKVVGPQLDGIAQRGLERVLEDIIDPNRNVDVAFRASTFVLRDGKVVSGLPRREEGKTLVIVDAKGEEASLAREEIATTSRSELSLMPDNLGETIADVDFADLIAFLLAPAAAHP